MRQIRIFGWFLVLFAFVCSTYADVYLVDNDDGPPGFVTSGTWTVSSSPGYNGGTYVFTMDPAFDPELYPYGYAVWTPEILIPGNYEVSAIFRTSSNRTTNAPMTITHKGGTDIVNLNMNGSNQIREIYLGEYGFDAGTSGSVKLDNTGAPGAYIADVIKFSTPKDDPPEIRDVIRDPSYPGEGDTVNVTAKITDDGTVQSATLDYSSTPSGTSGSTTMYDDGLHGDGAAGDDVYGGTIPSQPLGVTVVYSLTALDNGGQPTTGPDFVYIVGETAKREYRCIWADSWNRSFLNQSQADELVQTCRDNNINTIIVEIRKVGDACYASNLEPRATNISGGSSFDPLGYLLSIAHDTSGGKEYVEVHGWFVMQRIATSSSLDPQHILSLHPEYVMLNSGGSSGGSTKFLDPGHPDAVDHNVAVIVDCLENYQLDGVNMDYIRYPEASGDWGYNPVSVARFNAFYGKSGQPSSSDPDWADWRRDCVTREVKKVYIKSLMVNPDVVITADTVNWGYSYDDFEHSSAYAGVYQDWVGWLKQGILDYNALMSYSTSSSRHEGWTDLSLASDDKRGSIIGIGAYLQSSVQNSMDQLKYARDKGADGLNIYDWYSEVNNTSESRTKFYQELKGQLYQEWVDPPIAPWKEHPATGIFEGNLTNDGVPVDHGSVMIQGEPDTKTLTDGSGWYAVMDVPPGNHTLVFSDSSETEKQIPASIPAAGDIVTVDCDLMMDPPDLIVDAIELDPPNPTTIDLVTFTAVVKNAGAGPAAGSTLSFKLGGETIPPTFPVPSLDPGTSFTVQRQMIFPRAMGYSATAIADINSEVDESDETNNKKIAHFQVTEPILPDLVVESLDHTPQSPDTSDTITLQMIVRNIGTLGAAASVLDLELDNFPFETIPVPALDPGTSHTIERDIRIRKFGFHPVSATADAGDLIKEIREDNNTATHQIEVKLPPMPDLVIKGIEHIPVYPTTSDTITLKTVFGNIGSDRSGTCTLSLLFEGDGTPFILDVPALDVGTTGSVDLEVAIELPGVYRVNALIDPDRIVPESNEHNNWWILEFEVYEPVLEKLKEYLLGKRELDPVEAILADANQDGIIDIADVVTLLRKYGGGQK